MNKQFPLTISLYEKNQNSSFLNNLLIKNISKSASPREFYEKLLTFGDIKHCKLDIDEHGNHKGIGHVTYQSPESSLLCIKTLHQKEFKGEKLDILDNISHIDSRNVVYLKHLPLSFNEKMLKEFLEVYGEISTVKMCTKENKFTGAAIVSFSDFRSANAAIKDLNLKGTAFPGQLPLYISYLQKKEERNSKNRMRNLMMIKNQVLLSRQSGPVVLFAKLIESNCFKNVEEFEKSLRLFIKVVMLSDFNPVSISVNFPRENALITIKNMNEAMTFLENYKRLIKPEFFIEIVNQSPITAEIVEKNIKKNSTEDVRETQQKKPFNYKDEDNAINSITQADNNLSQAPQQQNVENMQTHSQLLPQQMGNLLVQNNNHNIRTVPGLEINNGVIKPNVIVPQIPMQHSYSPFQNPYNPILNNMVMNPYSQQPLVPPMYQNTMGGYLNQPFIGNHPMHMQNNMGYNNNTPLMGMTPQMNPMNMGVSPPINNYNMMNNHMGMLNNYPSTQNRDIVENEKLIFSGGESIRNSHFDSKVEFNLEDERLKEMSKEELCNEIYDKIALVYEKEASKITGMISDLGDDEMRRLLANPPEMRDLVNQAYQMLHE